MKTIKFNKECFNLLLRLISNIEHFLPLKSVTYMPLVTKIIIILVALDISALHCCICVLLRNIIQIVKIE